jgi:WD40 repeat protein
MNGPARSEPPTTQVKKDDEAKKPVRTDRHGDPLPPVALMRLGTIRFRHPGEILALAVSPDGKLIATGGMHGQVCLWERASGKLITTLQGPDRQVNVLQFSPDGKTRASGGAGEHRDKPDPGQIVLWDVRTLKSRHKLAQPDWTLCFAFTPDSTTVVASCGYSKEEFTAWEVDSGKELRRLPAGGPLAAAFSPDGRILATTGGEEGCSVRLWNWRTGREIGLFNAGSRVIAIAFAPAGKTLVTGQTAPHFVRLWDVAGRKLLRELDGHKKLQLRAGRSHAVAFAPDGATLASGGDDGAVLPWDVRTGKLSAKHQDPEGAINGVAFTPDGKTLVAGGESGRILIFDAATGKKLHPRDDHQEQLVHMELAPNGRLLATVGREGTIRLWDLAAGKTVRAFRGHRDLVGSVQFSLDARAMVSAGAGGTVYLWDVATGRGRELFEANCPWSSAAFTADDSKIVTAEVNGTVRLWDSATRKELMQLQGREYAVGDPVLKNLAVSSNGKWVAAMIHEFRTGWSIRLWEVANREKPRRLELEDRPFWLRFTPDNASMVYRGGFDSRMHFVDVATGQETHPSSTTGVQHFTFAAGGRWLVTAHDDATIRIREQASGLELHRIKGPDCGMWEVAVAPDSRTLLTLNRDKTILVWDLAPPDGRRAEANPKQIAQFWADLAGRDGPAGYRAMWVLTAYPERAVTALGARLPECQQALAKRRQRFPLILADLVNDSFQRREAASKELEKLRAEAEPVIRKALGKKPSLEVRRRLEKLLAKPPLVPPGELLRGIRAVGVLEHIGTPEARQVLETAAKGPADDRLAKEAKSALERLAKRPAAKP